MINIFSIASDDQSVYYLYQIFGYVGNVLPPPNLASTATVTTAPIILGTMFKTFNTVVLAVGALIVLYVTVIGVLKTAHEGEFLGKEWNKLWVPLRMVMGIAALIPTPSGYSIIQIIMMWVVLQGVGAADTVWSTVLQYTKLMGSPLSTLSIPTVGVSANIQNLYQALVCQATSKLPNQINVPGTGDGKYYCDSEGSHAGEPFCTNPDESMLNITSGSQVTSNAAIITYSMGPSGACGSMSFCNAEATPAPTFTAGAVTTAPQLTALIYKNACTAQVGALQSIVSVLGAIASTFATDDYNYRVFFYKERDTKNIPSFVSSYCSANNISTSQCCVPGPATTSDSTDELSLGEPSLVCSLPGAFTAGDPYNAATDTVQQLYLPYAIQPATGNVDFINASVSNYVTSLNAAVISTIQQQVSQTNVSTDATWIGQAQQQGWIFAGAYYYKMAQNTNSNVTAAMPILITTGIDPRSDTGSILFSLRTNFGAASDLINELANTSGTASDFSMQLPPKLQSLNKLSDGLSSASKSVMNSFMSMTTGSSTGQLATNPLASLQLLGKILLIIAQVLFALIIIVVPLITLLGYLGIFALGTGATNSIGPTVSTLAILFAPLFALFLGFLFIFGASLAIYTPLIPYIIFTMGAIAWFILVIEAMIAAPIVALGILSPSGRHEFLGHADQAVFYAFSLFLRPTLMIFGMIAAMLLSIVVVTMINAAFSAVMGTVYTNPGIVETIFFMAAYVSLILAALNKCFALIHIIPDTVLRWIGHTAGAGEAAGHAEAVKGVEGGIQKAGGEMQAAGKQAVGQAQKAAKEIGEVSKDQEEAAKQGAQLSAGAPPTGGGGKKPKGGAGGPPEMPSG